MNKSEFKNQFGNHIKVVDARVTAMKLIFSMAVVLLLAGALILSFPKFFAYIFATFLIFIGGLATFLAWKVYKFKKKVEEQFAKIKPTVSVMMDGMPLDIEEYTEDGLTVEKEVIREDDGDVTFVDYKKITWH